MRLWYSYKMENCSCKVTKLEAYILEWKVLQEVVSRGEAHYK